MVAEKQVVYKKFPITLINRLEKHTLTMETILTREQKQMAHELEMWAKEFVTSSPTQHRLVTVTVSNKYFTRKSNVLLYLPDHFACLVNCAKYAL